MIDKKTFVEKSEKIINHIGSQNLVYVPLNVRIKMSYEIWKEFYDSNK